LRFVGALTGLAFFALISLAPACVAWTRAVRDAPRDAATNPIMSLNAARFLPEADLKSIEWLRQNARLGETVIEATSGDWDANYGRVGAFSGVPTMLGWPQHVSGWGASGEEINRRGALIKSIYAPPYAPDAISQLGATYLFVGTQEGNANGELLTKIQARYPSSKPVEAQILRLVP
jgi:uncharacterized membrane protein